MQSKTKLVSAEMTVQKFCSEIALVPLDEDPNAIFEQVCDLWLRTTGADWIWLWGKNEFANTFQLSAVYPTDYQKQHIPNPIGVDSKCIASLAIKMGRPVSFVDFDKFIKFEGTTYSVKNKEPLQDLGCKGFVTIPLSLPLNYKGIERDEEQLDFEGSICLHFKSIERMQCIPDDEQLLTMGRLSRARIVDAYQAQRFRILVELNKLSRRFVPRFAKSPDIDRNDYLAEISCVLKKYIRTNAVSFFYRQPYGDTINCLYSDGLIKGDGTRVPRDTLSNATYKLGESKTGTCFMDGKPRIVLVEDNAVDTGKYHECDSTGHPTLGPTLLCPIPRSSEKKPRIAGPYADGVIRCTGHTATYSSEHTDFNLMEVETVKFISEQISPILDLLASRRQREWQVSVIKHDLEIPITMISDTIQKLASRGQISESSGYAKDDILVACKLLSQLTSQLSFEASQILVHKQPTRLLGDIIARSIQMLRHFASQDNDMKIEYTGIDEIPALMIDPILTERVIHNLVMNAVKYGTEGTTIRLTGGKNDVCYYVDIENFGIGITENEAQHLFRRYFRSARAKKRRHGVGIGLYMAKTIMELQKCSLVLKQLDNPTVFRVSFPRSAMMK
ncbi:MAG: HAMP domain-containing histidine kinase [Pirellula sp.]|jgi:hypothetical protein|nr:HAMP domain-containing histidine kinase [Pirellula sp.]